MKLVFCGTPLFAVPTLERLAAAGHELQLVVTQPDRPQGRGMELTAPPVKQSALKLGLPILQPEKIKKKMAKWLKYDLGKVAGEWAYSQITPKILVEPMLEGVDEAMVVSGHTHVQFDRVVADRRLVNAGSVGMAYQGESGAAYWTMFGPTVEHRRSGFDADALATALRESGYPNPEWFEPESAEDAAADYEQMAQEQR